MIKGIYDKDYIKKKEYYIDFREPTNFIAIDLVDENGKIAYNLFRINKETGSLFLETNIRSKETGFDLSEYGSLRVYQEGKELIPY